MPTPTLYCLVIEWPNMTTEVVVFRRMRDLRETSEALDPRAVSTMLRGALVTTGRPASTALVVFADSRPVEVHLAPDLASAGKLADQLVEAGFRVSLCELSTAVASSADERIEELMSRVLPDEPSDRDTATVDRLALVRESLAAAGRLCPTCRAIALDADPTRNGRSATGELICWACSREAA